MSPTQNQAGFSLKEAAAALGAVSLVGVSLMGLKDLLTSRDNFQFSKFNGNPTKESFGSIDEKCSEMAELFRSLRKQHLPEHHLSIDGKGPKQVGQQEIDRALQALGLISDLLEKGYVESDTRWFQSGPLIYEGNGFHGMRMRDISSSHDYHARIRAGKGYQELTNEAAICREFISYNLRNAAERIQSSGVFDATDSVTAAVAGDVLIKLPVLADKLEERRLFTPNAASRLSRDGQADNLSEVVNGLKFLLRELH